RRPRDGGEDDVEVAVAIDVGDGGTARDHGPQEIGRATEDRLRECATACRPGVPEQVRRLSVALARLNLLDLFFDVTVCGQEVEAAIEIVVEEQHAEGQSPAAL